MTDGEMLRAIGQRIREARAAARMTPKQLARAAYVTPDSVRLWETAVNGISATNAIRVAAALRVSVGWLLLGEETGP